MDGSHAQLERLKFISSKLGKSVKTLKLEFDGPDMPTLPDGNEYRNAMLEFTCLERLCLAVHAGTAYKLIFNQLFMTPERVPFFYTLQHIEVYDIAETGDTSLRNLAQFLTNIKQRYTLKYYSNQLLHKLLENIHEGSFSQIQFSLVNGPLNNATFTNLRRINPDSIVIDGERMGSTIDDN